MSLLYAKFYCVHNLIVCSMCAHCYCVQFLSLCVAVSTQFLLRTVGNCVQFLSLCVAVSTLFLLRTVGNCVQILSLCVAVSTLFYYAQLATVCNCFNVCFALQANLRPRSGKTAIGKRIWRRGPLLKETISRVPGVQILQRPVSGIFSVPTESQSGRHGHFPKSSLIA